LKYPRFRILAVVLILSLVSTVFAQATHNPNNDRYIDTGNPNSHVLPIEHMQKIADRHAERWEKLAEKLGREIEYSYNWICGQDGECMPVDPPQFSK
jgi:hypothetical protein